MLGTDLAEEISGKFLHSYIRTCQQYVPRATSVTPIGQGRNQAGAQSDLDLAAEPWSRNVRMYESRPFILSQTLDAATGSKDLRTFLRSYADC